MLPADPPPSHIAMASELPPVIDEELLHCSLCMRSYQEPRILPCLHTFCLACLEVHLAKTQPVLTEQFAKQLTDSESLKVSEPTKPLPDLIKQLIPPEQADVDTKSLSDTGRCSPATNDEVDVSSEDGSNSHCEQNINEVESHSGQRQVSPRSKVRPPIPLKPAGLVIPPYPAHVQKRPAVHVSEPSSASDQVMPPSIAQTCTPTLPLRTPAKNALQSEQSTCSKSSPPPTETPEQLPRDTPATQAPQKAQEIPEMGEDMDDHYEEVNHGLRLIKNGDDEEYYCIAEPDEKVNLSFDSDVDYVEPIQTIIKDESMKINNNEKPVISTCTEENAVLSPQVTPKQQRGNFLSNLFRRKSPDKKKHRNSDPSELCGIQELPVLPRGEHSPYSPSPCLSLKSLTRAPIPTPEESVGRCTPPDGSTGRSIPVDGSTGQSTTPVSLPSPSPTTAHSSIATPDATPTLAPRANLQPPQLPKRNVLQSPSPASPDRSPSPSNSSLTERDPTPPTPNPLATVVSPSPLSPIPHSPISPCAPNPLLLPFSGNPMIMNQPDISSKGTSPQSPSHSNLTMNCPTCFTEFAIPETGIKGLKVNSFATSLQEVVLTQSSSEKQCNNCETSLATFRCLDCHHYLCSGCRNAHNWLKITKTHRIMTLGELRSGRYQKELTQKQEIKCDIHTQNKVELMCLYCDKPICAECKIEEHCDHRVGHLSEAADRDGDLLRSLIDSVQAQMMLFEDTQQDILQYQAQCSNEKQELIEGLGHQRDSIIEAVNEAFLNLVEEINGAYEEELDNSGRVHSQIGSTMAHMNHNCGLAEQLLMHGKTEDVLVMSRLIKPILNEFSFAAPFELDTRPFVQYSPADFHKPMFIPLFGRLAKRKSDIIRPKHVIHHRALERGAEVEEPTLLHSFRAKTLNDTLGCKPSGLTLSVNDDIVIVDDTNKKVKVFDPSGIVKMELRPVGRHSFIDPWDVTITYQGHLAVTDKGARCVKVFNSRGQFIHEFGPHLKSPWGIAANSQGHLIVTDILVKTVFVHDQEGNLLHPIECKGHTNLFMCPEYVKVNHNDDIIVSDFVKHCITVFDSQGRFLFRYGSRGNQMHQFVTPCGIGIDKAGHIFVADYTNNRVHKLTRDGQFVQFALSAKQGIVAPQTLLVNSQDHLVVLDGTNIKTFMLPHGSHTNSDSDSDIDPNYEPLQFSNRLYDGAHIRFSMAITESDA